MVYTLRFFSLKCSLFHNSNLFGFCIIHILYTVCAKIKKKKFRRQKVNCTYACSLLILCTEFHVPCMHIKFYRSWPDGTKAPARMTQMNMSKKWLGAADRRKLKYWERELFLCHSIHCKFRIDWQFTWSLTLILRRSRTGTVWFYTSTSNKRAARPKLYTKSLTGDLKLMYSRFTLLRISINL